jgi:hypothetical protein
MGDFSPTRLMNAMIKGDGFPAPRTMGAMTFGLGLVLLIANIILIAVLNIYFPYFLVVAWPAMGAGFWMLVLGQPLAQPDGSPAPLWGRIVVGAALVLGLLAGVGSIFAVHM